MQQGLGANFVIYNIGCIQQINIDNVLIGVDSKQQLEDNLKSLNYALEASIINEINNIKVSNINLLNPSLWN